MCASKISLRIFPRLWNLAAIEIAFRQSPAAAAFFMVCSLVSISTSIVNHCKLVHKRILGKWFNLTAQDIQYIDDALESVDEVINGER